jgi:predicted DNA-binding mobile mystery protein A
MFAFVWLYPYICITIYGYSHMKSKQKTLAIAQFDRKISDFNKSPMPSSGWIKSIRLMLGMSLRQFGKKLGIIAASANEIEQREMEGSITLKRLREAANAFDMDVYYYLVPRSGTLEKFIEKKANEMARQIVLRTSQSMLLEEQGNTPERIEKAIKEKTEEIKISMPKYLWE